MIIFIGVVTGFNYGFITQVMLEHGKVLQNYQIFGTIRNNVRIRQWDNAPNGRTYCGD